MARAAKTKNTTPAALLLRCAAGCAALLAGAGASADPCPDLLEPGVIEVSAWPAEGFAGNPDNVAVRVTVRDTSGTVVAQREDDARAVHVFSGMQPGEYSLTLEGDGVQSVEKTGVVVVAKRTTGVKAFMRRP